MDLCVITAQICLEQLGFSQQNVSVNKACVSVRWRPGSSR